MPTRKTTIGLMLIGPWFLSFIQSAALDLNVGAYFEIKTTNRGWNSDGVRPAVQLAVDHVNKRDDVLPGYNLKLNVKDSRCSGAYAIKALIEHLSDPRTFIALFGPGCALATEPVASVARFWNLIQISYSAGSPRLSDKTRYPTVFRLNSDETKFNEGIVALLKHFKWNKVAVVKQDEAMFNDVNEVLQALFKKENITLLASNSFVDNPDNVIKDLKEKDARIIITLMYEDRCRRLMCSAYKNGFHGHHRVWFLRGWYTASWWNKTEKDVNCTAEQIKLAAGSYLATERIIFSDVPNKPTVAGWTASELRQLYKARLKNTSQEENSYAPYGYDSIWFLALALNQTMALLTKHNLSLFNFTYKGQQSRIIKESLHQSLLETRFIGMSGDVGFSEKGERKNKIWIEQMQGTKEVRVGTFSSENSSIEIISNRSFKWPDGKGVPSDHRIMIKRRQKVSLLLFVILVVMSSLGIIMAISFLIFNIRNRASSLIKMSSPNINNIMAVGCIMCYACVFLLGADSLLDQDSQITTHSTLCKARLWVMSVGFTMAYGAMFVKTWRVYRIFTNTNMKKELGRLHDRHLIGILVTLVIWDLLYLSVWQSISPLTTESKMVRGLMPKDETNVIHFVWVCNCEHIGTWMASLYAYKGLLLAIGVFLAWETRNVNYPALNDSRQIGISVYNVVLCSSIAILLDYALKQRTSVNISFVLSGTLVNICISFSLGLLFLTKIHALRFKPTVHVQGDQPPTISTQSKSRPHPNCPACKCE